MVAKDWSYLPHLFLLLGDFLGHLPASPSLLPLPFHHLEHLLRAVHLLHSPLSQTFLVLTSSLLDLVASLSESLFFSSELAWFALGLITCFAQVSSVSVGLLCFRFPRTLQSFRFPRTLQLFLLGVVLGLS